MSLERKRAGLLLKLAPDDSATDVGTFEGYGACFGNVDAYGDVIEKGAFKKTLAAWRKQKKFPPMLLQHGGMFGPAEDGIPIGCYEDMYEDETGLFCKGALFCLDTDKGKYIHAGLKSGALDGLSIGYIADKVTYGKKPDEPRRTLNMVTLMEVSIVTYPANDAARVSSAKSIEDIATLSDAETYLRDACGFSRQQALAFVSRVKGLRPSDSERQAATALQASAAKLLSTFKAR